MSLCQPRSDPWVGPSTLSLFLASPLQWVGSSHRRSPPVAGCCLVLNAGGRLDLNAGGRRLDATTYACGLYACGLIARVRLWAWFLFVGASPSPLRFASFAAFSYRFGVLVIFISFETFPAAFVFFFVKETFVAGAIVERNKLFAGRFVWHVFICSWCRSSIVRIICFSVSVCVCGVFAF